MILHVACAAEGAEYVAHSAAMLDSVAAHTAPYALHVHYLCGPRMDPEDAARLEAMLGGRITFHRIADAQVAGLPAPEQFTSAMWHRFLLPDLLADLDRVLYLDVDTLAVDALAPLWETNLRGAPVGAVTNVLQHNHRFRPAELGLTAPYFNSGVLLLDLAAHRREGLGAQLLDVARTRGAALEWPDQDALNLVLGERRHALHPRWNCMNSVYALPGAAAALGRRARFQARRRPAIRHFEGPGANKAWHPDCPFPLAERYAAHRARTPFQALTAIRPA